jgi:hypothetical protein
VLLQQQDTNHLLALANSESSSTGDESELNPDNSMADNYPGTDTELPRRHIQFHPMLDGTYPLSTMVHLSLTSRISQGHHVIPLTMISL